MSKTNKFMANLYELEQIESLLKAHLKESEYLLNTLLCKRESIICPVNKQKWDISQYRLDDLQQHLGNIGESLQEIAPVESILQHLIDE
jgi:hypothetical protein